MPHASQIDLVNVVLNHLVKRGFKTLTASKLNAVITACSAITDAVNAPDKPACEGMTLRQWWESDDAGASSRFLAATFDRDLPRVPCAHPRDASDFSRCVTLIRIFPGARAAVDAAAAQHEVWKALAARWDDLALMSICNPKACDDLIHKLTHP